VVGAPPYFAKHPKPKHPRDLVDHECLNWHSTLDAPPYRWEFTENGAGFSVAVPRRVLTTDAVLIARLTLAGVGLAMLFENQVRDEIARGDLRGGASGPRRAAHAPVVNGGLSRQQQRQVDAGRS
jgi:DNA-binding transcriptional LysR family regulator